MLCTFWLANALIHNGVQLFISHLTTWLRTHRFSAPTFRPSRATNHWKNAVFSTFSYLFARLDLLSSHSFSFWSSFFFSSLTLPISAFHLSILSEVWLLNFFGYPYIMITVTEIWELWISHVFQRYFSGSFGVRFWICWQRLAPKKWWRTANSACQAG